MLRGTEIQVSSEEQVRSVKHLPGQIRLETRQLEITTRLSGGGGTGHRHATITLYIWPCSLLNGITGYR